MVVQKFGGTSVADPDAIQRLIQIVRTARTRDGRGPAVVVSAMSGVTDTLLAIAPADSGAVELRREVAAVIESRRAWPTVVPPIGVGSLHCGPLKVTFQLIC